MNFNTIIDACDEKELYSMLDAIALKNKKALSKWINEHQDIITPPVEAEPKPETPKLSEEESKQLQDMTLEMIKMNIEGEKGADLEVVIANLMDLGYDRENILEAIDMLLDKGKIYEPFIGKLGVVQ